MRRPGASRKVERVMDTDRKAHGGGFRAVRGKWRLRFLPARDRKKVEQDWWPERW